MPVRILPLDEETLDHLRGIISAVYLDGECYELAFALHRLTGWPIVALNTIGLKETDLEHAFRHAAVRDPKGMLHDARGTVSPQDFGRPFGLRTSVESRLHVVTEDEVRQVRPVNEYAVNRAAQLAEVVWPELALLAEARRSRYQRFVEALEALSREHGIWVRSPLPAAHHRPCLAEGEGDELGYDMQPSIEGNAYLFDRRLS